MTKVRSAILIPFVVLLITSLVTALAYSNVITIKTLVDLSTSPLSADSKDGKNLTQQIVEEDIHLPITSFDSFIPSTKFEVLYPQHIELCFQHLHLDITKPPSPSTLT